MANLQSMGINSLNEIEADSGPGYSAIPPGQYRALVLEVDLRTTKAGTGQYLACKFQLLDAPYDRRFVWSNLNISNPSEQAQKIGRAQFKDFSQACGFEDLQDTDQLLDQEIGLDIVLDKVDNTRNQVRGYFNAAGEKLAPIVEKPQQAAKTTAPAAAKNPWQK